MILEIFLFFIDHGISGLFAISVLSSIFPIPAEPVVFTLIGVGTPNYLLILTLFAGSVIGASIGYVVGRYKLRKLIPRHRYEKHEAHIKAEMQKYGADLLLFVSPWIPIVGDLAPIIAGFEKYNAHRFFAVITLAKACKSIGLIYLSATWMDLVARIIA